MRLSLLGIAVHASACLANALVNITSTNEGAILSRPRRNDDTDLASFLDKPVNHPCAFSPNSARRLMGHGFHRFHWVAETHLQPGDHLGRSSAPHYDCDDNSQALTIESVDFLKKNHITNVISLNAYADSPAIKATMRANRISYTPIPVGDYQTPNLADLQKGYKSFVETRNGATLVWCGYGHGRTGVMITAINMFREAEKTHPKQLTSSDFKSADVETKAQVEVLNKLQDTLKVNGAEQQLLRAVDDFIQAKHYFNEIKEAKSVGAKMRMRCIAENRLSAATATIQDAMLVADFHWQIDRVLFDRIVKTYAWKQKKNALPQDESLVLLDRLMRNVQLEMNRPYFGERLLQQTWVIAEALRAVLEHLEASRKAPSTPSKQQASTPDMETQISKFEDYRRITRALFIKLRKQMKNYETEARDMKQSLVDPEAIEFLKTKMRKLRLDLSKARDRAVGADDMAIIYDAADAASDYITEAHDVAANLAEIIKSSSKLTNKDFVDVRNMLHEMRVGMAEILAKETSQFISIYIVEEWGNRADVSTDSEAIQRQADDLTRVAAFAQAQATKLGELLQQKANNLNLIKNLIQHPKLQFFEFDAEIGLKETSVVWLEGKEQAVEALEYERNALEAELAIAQGPIHAFVTTALLVKREAELATAVAEEAAKNGNAEQKLLQWRRDSLTQLIDTLRHEVEVQGAKEATAPAIAEPARKEPAAVTSPTEAAQTGTWKVELGIDIALAVLAAVPLPETPIVDVIIWARQALRTSRFLRRASRVVKNIGPEVLTRVQHATRDIDQALSQWRMIVPASTRSWALDKTPTQIIDGLTEIQQELVEAEQVGEQPLPWKPEEGTSQAEAGTSQAEAGTSQAKAGTSQAEAGSSQAEAGTSHAQPEPQPHAEIKPKLKPYQTEKSIEEIMQDLESIQVPHEEPGDVELAKPISKMLEKLNRSEKPLSRAAKKKESSHDFLPPQLASRTVSELQVELREAALIPHHSSDVDFKQLLDDAAYYLPADADLDADSLGMSIISTVREGAVAA